LLLPVDAPRSRLFVQGKPEKQPLRSFIAAYPVLRSIRWMTDVRGLIILFVAFAIMLAVRGPRQEDIVVPRPTTPMPAVNVP
jgi:hypothetical protein